jgi:hypothetical protein
MSSEFEIRGEFAGFVRDGRGKQRMMLRTGEEELLFKMPKELRKRFADRLVPGLVIVVSGIEERVRFSGWIKRIVSRLEFLEAPGVTACESCPIRICAKKNCWKDGGHALWRVLEEKIEAAGLTGVIRLKAVGCMDHCKRAPNLSCGDTHIEQCTPELAEKLIDRLAAKRQ